MGYILFILKNSSKNGSQSFYITKNCYFKKLVIEIKKGNEIRMKSNFKNQKIGLFIIFSIFILNAVFLILRKNNSEYFIIVPDVLINSLFLSRLIFYDIYTVIDEKNEENKIYYDNSYIS